MNAQMQRLIEEQEKEKAERLKNIAELKKREQELQNKKK